MNRRKTMTEKVEEYLAYRQRLGYQLPREGQLLRQFGAFAETSKHRGPLTVALAVQWARLPTDADPSYWAIRLKAVRGFARYLAISEPGTEVPPHRLLGPVRRRQPYIYPEVEVSALMAAARQLPPVNGLRPWTYVTLIGLLASTGLRISEALRFTRSDFDEHQGVLLVREAKFRKSRLVPLHPSTAEALRAYARQRDCLVPSASVEQFLITDRGTRLRYGTVHRAFHKLCIGLPTSMKDARPRRRIHDLRHTFACRRLQRWYDTESDVAHAVAALAVYLGHANVSHTYWYLTATPELLACAAARFEPFACLGKEGQP
jgi:integrase